MSFRKFLFWLHLIAGLIAGLSIAVMCITGVTLAFEKQLLAWAERDVRLVTPPSPDAARLSLDDLSRRLREQKPDLRPSAIVVSADPRAAVAFSLGRDATLYADPYTGEFREPSAGAARLHAFLHTMEEWHRWLALSGDSRPVGKLINGTCNAAFLVLAVTGLYLWLPRSWSWRSVRAVALLNLRASGKARDFNWHNAIGLWSAPVLIVLTLTALPMSFRWANNLVYQLAGDTPPPANSGPGGPPAGAPAITLPTPPPGARPLDRAALFASVSQAYPGWEQITLRLSNPAPRNSPPAATGSSLAAQPRTSPPPAPGLSGEKDARRTPQPLVFSVKLPDAWPRTALVNATLDPFTGAILRRENFADLSPGRQARTWTRFLHTGEALGLVGQFVAGLATLGGCVLVYTGFALAWRRFFGRATAN